MGRITAGVEFHHPPKLPIVYLLPAKIAICKICVGQGGVGHKRPTPRGPIRPGGAQMGAPPARGILRRLHGHRRGECPSGYASRPFPASAPAGRWVPLPPPQKPPSCSIAAPSRAAFLRRGSAHRRPALSRGPVPAKTKPDAFPQVAGEAPGVSCIGLLRRAAASGGD